MALRRPVEPLHNALIGRICLDSSRELIIRDAGKLQQAKVHGAGVEVFTFSAGQDGAAFVDHASEMDIALQLESHAAGKGCPKVHGTAEEGLPALSAWQGRGRG